VHAIRKTFFVFLKKMKCSLSWKLAGEGQKMKEEE